MYHLLELKMFMLKVACATSIPTASNTDVKNAVNFSKVTFDAPLVSLDDVDFWKKVLPEVCC